jgi:hypothetical protein
MAYPEPQYQKQETAKDYTKQYELNNSDSILTRQEDGMLGYISAGQFATTSSNEFIGNQFISGNLTVTGDISAHNFVTSSTLLFTGSTNHGSLIGDIHTYTGSVRITGSLNIIGSTVQIGNNAVSGNSIMSGSVGISGSTLIQGNTTISGSTLIQGNTTIKGMLFVSGSTNFSNHTITMTGSMFTSGSQVITGSLDINGNVNISSGSEFYLHGNKMFNYGAFYDTRTQSGSANVSSSIKFNSTDYSEGVSISNNTRVVLANVGVYNIQFSAQLVDTSFGDSTIHIWLKKNGQNVPNSAGRIYLAANEETLAAWNYVVPATSPNDYYELVWQSTDADARILYQAATGNIPAIPSIILTVTQVA